MISTVLAFIGQADEGRVPALPVASKTRDESEAKTIRAEGNDRFREHMSGYLIKLAESLAKAESALAEQDFKTIREIVHKWIGPSASLGIPELSDEGGLLQDAARTEQSQLVRKQLGQTREYATRLEIVYANGDALKAPLASPGT
jgi:HPt (histidine-containing phosphotransfer) domain-containing protein